MAIADYFTKQELDAIRAATRAAEARTGGELVCVIVERCDSYEASVWKAATLGALAGSAFGSLGYSLRAGWAEAATPWILIPPLIGAAMGLLSVLLVPWLQRVLIPPRVIERRVDRRAAVAFLDEEIFSTRDRTGVLIFVALFEHQIRILRDEGVEDKIPPSGWSKIADELARGLRRRDPGAAIVRAVESAGDLLEKGGVPRRGDDRDELSNEPRLYDE